MKAIPRAHPEIDFGMLRGSDLRRAEDHRGHAPVLPTMRLPLCMDPDGKTGPCPLLAGWLSSSPSHEEGTAILFPARTLRRRARASSRKQDGCPQC
jgi:hypothetical protein